MDWACHHPGNYHHEVIVTNLGTVCRGYPRVQAVYAARDYAERVRAGTIRGEFPIYVMNKDELVLEITE